MPVGLLAGLPAGQIESILLHELAHIRRHDYLVNLMQIVVESLVFYHPAVWWISGVMRAERENCCDDLVVATQGDAFAYAAALTALEQNRGTVRDAVLAATGGSLVKRVRRLLDSTGGAARRSDPRLLRRHSYHHGRGSHGGMASHSAAASPAGRAVRGTTPGPGAGNTRACPGGYAVHQVAHSGCRLHHQQ